MPSDMKKLIAEAVRTLLVEKRVKKLTVTDIVEECHITRQTFYYHFADIPSLLKWILEQSTDQLMKAAQGQKKDEDAFRYFFVMAIQAKPYLKRTLESNYRNEIEQLLKDQIYRMFERVVEDAQLYPECSPFDRKLILRYHSLAVIGLLREWTEEDSQNLDAIVHAVYLLMRGEISPDSGLVRGRGPV